jgi:hypothetical protein
VIYTKLKRIQSNGKIHSVPGVVQEHSWLIMEIDSPVENVDTPNGRVVPELL